MRKMCAKCGVNEKCNDHNSYCRPCKNAMDLKSYHNNNDKRRKYVKDYLDKNPERREKNVLSTRKWREENPHYIADWVTEKIKTDPQYYLRSIINSSLHGYLKSSNDQNPIWYLGCTLEEFKIYIENQFDDKMNWENRGRFGWHIDHIKPVNTFDLTNEEQIKQCWNFSNLRPLWWEDNLKRPKDGSDI